MFFVIFILLVLISIAVHEFGHGFAMVRCGIKVPEGGLGIPVNKVPHLKFRISPKFTLFLHPLLLGAYVKAEEGEEEKIEKLPYRDKAYIFGAGIIANVVFGAVLNIIILSIILARFPERWDIQATVLFAVYLVLIFVFLVFRKFISSYVFPVLGILLTGFLIWSIVFLGFQESVTGPVGIVKIGLESKSLLETISLGAAVSIGFGLINLLPLFPMDGGRILNEVLKIRFNVKQTAENLINFTGFLIVIILIIVTFFFDILGVIN